MAVTAKKRIWGWYAFDWASQPYATLLLTFIFGPYFAEIHAARDIAAGASPEAARAAAQAAWGWGLALAGVAIAVTAPVLGAVADTQGRRIPWILAFSGLYVVGAAGLWVADPNDFDVTLVLLLFALGLMGMEFATIFTNALLPTLGPRDAIGRISGNGWGLGFAGGVVALAVVLLLFAENARGVTLLGAASPFWASRPPSASIRQSARAPGSSARSPRSGLSSS